MHSKLIVSKHSEPLTPDTMSRGASSRWLESEKQRLRLVSYPSNYIADHICHDGHAFYVTEGKITIQIDDEITEWVQGDAFIIPDGVPHVVKNPYKLAALVVVVD